MADSPTGPQLESVWSYPRPPKTEDSPSRILVVVDSFVVADSSRSKRILETSHPPSFYIPPEDIAMAHLVPVEYTTFCEWKGHASYFDLSVNGRRFERAAWYYADPTAEFRQIQHFVAFYPSGDVQCFVDNERVSSEAGRFYGGWVTKNITGLGRKG
jgi:uncharacterized protein (DUF427 family)